MCRSLTIIDIWTNFGIKLKYHTVNTPEWSNSHNLKIQDGGCRHLGFLGYVKNVNNSRLDKDIGIKFYGIMHWTLAYTTACTTVQAVIMACTVVQAVLTVWTVVSCSNNFSTVPNLVVAGWATGAPQKLCEPCTSYNILHTLNNVTATEM